ncbi:MAG: M20 family metallopeptidase [Desulfobacterota bacterium]|nr:M20 family metallopeptidase [Thermodesulfobacteriota bacterium]
MKVDRFLSQKDLIELTRRLIRIPTENPPGNEGQAFEFLAPLISQLGFQTKIYRSPKGRVNLIARKRWGKGGRVLIFNGHLDVVPAGDASLWKHRPFGGDLVHGKIFGRGASDMKGGIASFLHAIAMLHRSDLPLKKGCLVLHLVSDEESHGHQGMAFLAKKLAIKADAAIVGEPTGLDLVIAQKGALWLKITTFGESAHGSRPDRGVNAIEKMMGLVERLKSIPLQKEHPLLGRPTINIGTIRGGTKVNMVPDRCEIEVDRRLIPGEDKEEVIREIRSALSPLRKDDPQFCYRIDERDFAEPSEIGQEEEIVRIGLEAAGEVLGPIPRVRGFSGFTDGRFYVNRFRIPTLIFGPGETEESHTTDESVRVEALVQAARIYARMILKFFKEDPKGLARGQT